MAYFSKSLTLPKCNYDIWDCEFLMIVAALQHWQHLLIGTQDPVTIQHYPNFFLHPCRTCRPCLVLVIILILARVLTPPNLPCPMSPVLPLVA